MKGQRIKRLLAIIIILLTVLFYGCSVIPAAAYKFGSSGDQVSEIQKRLKDWGYYSGDVDGKYGKATEDAVIAFQIKHKITIDGIVGAETAEKLGVALSSGNSRSGNSDVYLLARLVYGEARGESYTGKVAVAAVVLNRVESSLFPNTLAKVIYQKGAFSVVDDGQINLSPDSDALKAARDAINGWDPSGGALFYYNPNKTSNVYIRSRPVICTIGDHIFCK
ncbi:MAG: spore cortex-lytic enzyme [Christensenellales bacterium]